MSWRGNYLIPEGKIPAVYFFAIALKECGSQPDYISGGRALVCRSKLPSGPILPCH